MLRVRSASLAGCGLASVPLRRTRSSNEVQRIAAAREPPPHALEQLAALLLLPRFVLLLARRALLLRIAAARILLGGLLHVQLFDAHAGRLQRALEIVQAVAEQSRRVVAGSL